MASTVNIEPRTDEFISIFNMLKNNGVIANNEEFAKSIGYKSGSGLSEILGRRQNISWQKWLAFKQEYSAKIAELSEIPLAGEAGSEKKQEAIEELSPGQIMTVLARAIDKYAGAYEVQADLLKDIRSEMARADAQARMEANLNRVFGGLETVGERQDHAIKKILSELTEIKGKINGLSED